MTEAASNKTCLDCGASTPHLSRGRCHRCYQRHIYALKKTGSWEPITPAPPKERFLANTEHAANGCVLWTGTINAQTGYGSLSIGGVNQYVHRLAYTYFVGPIPEGMHVDHMCHNRDLSCTDGSNCMHRRCVNPEHLQAVPPRVNILGSSYTSASKNARKTHCKRGHEFTPENTAPSSRGGRACRACRNAKQRIYGARRRAEKKAQT